MEVVITYTQKLIYKVCSGFRSSTA